MLRCVILSLHDLEKIRMCRNIHEREAFWSFWAGFFQPSPWHQSLMFPALEGLCLDFTFWGLDDSDACKLRVCTPFHGQDSPDTSAKYLPD